MTDGMARLRIGFIPLTDAAALIVAADRGFAATEGLDLELVREVSWSNVRDKLNVGLFDAAHLLAPVAIASSLGIGHVRVPLVAPFVLGQNGNAITVSPRLFAALRTAADGDLVDPMVSARALARLVAERRDSKLEPFTLGMTFPFSNHNYQLRFWIAAAGIDPDEDVRLVVLPPPYMVDSLANGQLDGFCVGEPWSSVAVDLGIGRILHLGSELHARLAEKVLAVRASFAAKSPDVLRRLLRALDRAASFVAAPDNVEDVAAILSKPDHVNVAPALIRRSLDGRLVVGPDNEIRACDDAIVIGRNGAARPDPVQAAWIYAQMVRCGQAPMTPDLLAAAEAVFRPDLYDAAAGGRKMPAPGGPADGIGAFAGPPFRPDEIAADIAWWGPRN